MPSRSQIVGLGVMLSVFAGALHAADDVTLKNLTVQGTLDLENSVPLRWKKPDGSGYVNIATLDKNGTLRLCNDPYFFESNDAEHLAGKVIEVRNPLTGYADFRLPFTRSNNLNADSKLVIRSMSLIETNDPSEINLLRTGTDDPKNKDENGVIASGAVTGIIRWMGRRTKTDQPTNYGGYVTAAEIVGRSYGTSEKDHWGAIVFMPVDSRQGRQGDSGIVAMMKRGVRIGELAGSPGDAVTGSMLEVDSDDDRPVILRRHNATPGHGVSVALATGEGGKPAEASNTLALLSAEPRAEGSAASRVEIRTNSGGGELKTALVLPVPASELGVGAGVPIASGELVPLTFHLAREDDDAWQQTPKPTTRLTCHTPGRYAVSAFIEFAENGKGSRQVLIRRNGRDTVAAMRLRAADDGETTQITFTAPPVDLKPGDYVELLVRQTSGAPLEVLPSGQFAPAFAMLRVR